MIPHLPVVGPCLAARIYAGDPLDVGEAAHLLQVSRGDVLDLARRRVIKQMSFYPYAFDAKSVLAAVRDDRWRRRS